MTERPTVGRIAGPADEDAIYHLLLGLEADNGLGFPHEESAVRESIRQGTERRGGFVFVIDAPDEPGKIIASLGVHFGKFWYSNASYLHETWLFVDPAYRRGTGYADVLMQWARWLHAAFKQAQGEDVPFFTSVTSRKRFEAKRRWWSRRGTQIGAIYLLR